MQTQTKNRVKAVKSQGTYWVYVDEEFQLATFTREEVVNWLWFNWPVGTKVDWIVKP